MAGTTEPPGAAPPPEHPSRSDNPSDNAVQRTRAWTGLWVVAAGDVAIAVAAIWGVVRTSGSATNSPTIAILTSAFTAIGTMTTAYFGIKSMSNTAQSFAPAPSANPGPGPNPGPGASPGPGANLGPANPTPGADPTAPAKSEDELEEDREHAKMVEAEKRRHERVVEKQRQLKEHPQARIKPPSAGSD
jgi:hypothetical protein